MNAAVAARTAQAQGKFWEYHDMLYYNQSSGFSDENLIALAREAGLDTKRFESDYKSARYGGAVQADFQKAQNLGVPGTPTFFINGKVLVGFQPLEVFEKAIEDARREAEGG